MAVKIFNDLEIVAPSGSGPRECEQCNGRGHVMYGPIPTKTESCKDGWVMFHRVWCFDCDFFEESHGKEREDYLKRMGKL